MTDSAPNSEKSRYLELTLSRIDGNINTANLKASFLIATNGVILAMLLSNRSTFVTFLGTGTLRWVDNVLYLVILLASIVSLALALMVVHAFLGSGNQPTEYHSLIFFGSIKQLTLENFKKQLNHTSMDSYLDDLSNQVHLLSATTFKKYRCVNFSICFLYIALGSLSLMVFLYGIQNIAGLLPRG